MRSTTAHSLTLPGFGLSEMVAEAIDFLRSNEPAEGYFVGFSGGKDSIVTLELCRMAGVKHQAFYSCTRIDCQPQLSLGTWNRRDISALSGI